MTDVTDVTDAAPPDGPTAPPEADLHRVVAAESRLAVAVDGLTDEAAARPSRLPGWTVGHLLTHLARNADSHRRRTAAALRGEEVDQYPGGLAGREAEIEEGAGRTARQLLDDLHRSTEGMLQAWEGVPLRAWSVRSRDANGTVRTLADLPRRRWQEVEVHLVDLGTGPTHRAWSEEFVATFLPPMRARAAAALPEGTALPDPGTLDPADELAWLYGRLDRPDLPAPPPF